VAPGGSEVLLGRVSGVWVQFTTKSTAARCLIGGRGLVHRAGRRGTGRLEVGADPFGAPRPAPPWTWVTSPTHPTSPDPRSDVRPYLAAGSDGGLRPRLRTHPSRRICRTGSDDTPPEARRDHRGGLATYGRDRARSIGGRCVNLIRGRGADSIGKVRPATQAAARARATEGRHRVVGDRATVDRGSRACGS
jgi:hypothetical protein